MIPTQSFGKPIAWCGQDNIISSVENSDPGTEEWLKWINENHEENSLLAEESSITGAAGTDFLSSTRLSNQPPSPDQAAPEINVEGPVND